MFRWIVSAIVRRHHRQKNLNRVSLKISDQGIEYNHDGGTVRGSFYWDEVVEIQTFKVDCFVYDMVCLQFSTVNHVYVFKEEDVGFSELMVTIRQKYPSVPQAWYCEVMHPAFATNQRILWKRDA